VSEERAKGSEVWQLMDQWAYEADAQGKMQPSELPASRWGGILGSCACLSTLPYALSLS